MDISWKVVEATYSILHLFVYLFYSYLSNNLEEHSQEGKPQVQNFVQTLTFCTL